MTRGPWQLPDPRRAPAGVELLALSGPIEVDQVLTGYRRACSRWRWPSRSTGGIRRIHAASCPWTGFHASRSLRRSRGRFRVTFDQAFSAVVAACADPDRSGHWITADYEAVYRNLHDRGHAHSVEVWSGQRLAGGVFGVEQGGLFCGESMFHRQTDASKVALWALVERLAAAGDVARRVFDVQWWTPHLGSLGVIEVPRPFYLDLLGPALDLRPAF